VLDIINQQGAQVTMLKQQNQELAALVNLLVSTYVPGSSKVFTKADTEKAQGVSVGWKVAKNGNITLQIKRKKEKK